MEFALYLHRWDTGKECTLLTREQEGKAKVIRQKTSPKLSLFVFDVYQLMEAGEREDIWNGFVCHGCILELEFLNNLWGL